MGSDKGTSISIHEITSNELDIVTGICLDPSVPKTWKKAMKSSMEARKSWLASMMLHGLTVAIALGPRGGKKGLIEYVPIQLASEPVKGRTTLFINCLWVVPPAWEKGIAKALLRYAIDDGRKTGGISVLAYEGDKWFGYFPYMPASFFGKFGFKEVDRDGSRVLLHLDLGGDDQPSLIPPRTRQMHDTSTSTVEILFNNQCPWSGWMVDKAKRALKRYDVTVTSINTDDRKMVEKFGLSRGVIINGKPVIKRMATVKEIESAVKEIVPLKSQKGKHIH
ncbi:MAG: GNAT family N-acetyltransferase [Promethearchaeota archaeon]